MSNKQTSFTCANCGHGSLVRSNFKFTTDRKAYCNSKLRPNCESVRIVSDYYKPVESKPSYNPIEWR